MPKFINGFRPQSTCFDCYLIGKVQLTSHFFCATKIADNMHMVAQIYDHISSLNVSGDEIASL